jgi:hypothetical protein
MAYNVTVYDDNYPSNTKTVYVDIVSRVPAGEDGDERYILYVYAASTVYSNVTARTAVPPIFISDMRRGWAQSFSVNSPVTVSGYTLTVALDEADSGAVTLTTATGTFAGSILADNLQTQLQLTASGVKSTASNILSYRNAQVKYEDGKFLILSGSTKKSFNSSSWGDTSSAKVTGGTGAETLGFTTGYPNSYDLATTASGELHGPASAHVSVDDAIKWALMCITNNIDFSG